MAAAGAGAGPAADGADTGAASGFGCSLALSARSCTYQYTTQSGDQQQARQECTRHAEAAGQTGESTHTACGTVGLRYI